MERKGAFMNFTSLFLPMKKALLPILLFLVFTHLSLAQGATEGGNVTEINLTLNATTEYWAGIVGWMRNNTANPALPISYEEVDGVDIYTNLPNGTYYNISLVVTRLPDKPVASGISSPSLADFATGGMFSDFTAFTDLDFTTFVDSPLFTFGAASLMNCTVGGATYPCPYITLLPDTRMGVLKFSNATSNEPLFITVIENKPGYNGSYFDFELVVPRSESYYFYVYVPPEVRIISPAPTTYPTGTIPFRYSITSYGEDVDSCWYVLDGATTIMPDCTIPYVLSVGSGAHTLTLYANNTDGGLDWDSVSFSVSNTPPGPTGGPGAAHIPQTPPAYGQLEVHPGQLEVHPENIFISINYPLSGEAGFTLYSGDNLTDAYCYASGDFENYTSVTLESDSIRAGEAIRGTVTVSMPPTTILDYSGSTEGLLQCVGRRQSDPALILSTTANVRLILNKPEIAVENITIELLRGELTTNITLTNVGNGSAYAYNLSAEFTGPFGRLFTVDSLPQILLNGESGALAFTVYIPIELEPGIYRIAIYESGRLVGTGTLTILVEEGISPPRCSFPDLGWTVIILLAGMLAAVFPHYKGEEEAGRESSRTPGILRPLAAGLLSLAVWAIIIWLLGKCT
jgi:hypothetical protein